MADLIPNSLSILDKCIGCNAGCGGLAIAHLLRK